MGWIFLHTLICPYFYSSFRDSTYTDADGFSDGREANGIEQIFEGINRDLVSLANSGHLADSEGDNGDAEPDDEVKPSFLSGHLHK